jgi:hypothetical protein
MLSIPSLRRSVLPAFPLVVACAASPTAASSPPFRPPPAQQESFEPIRYGDDAAHAYEAPFFQIEGRAPQYDPSIPTPDSLLGRPVGSRLAHHAEIISAFRRWAELSPRIRVESYGRTYEGRELVYALISSKENLTRIETIRGDIHRLWDPRGTSAEEGERICAETPAIAWLGYSIHGDETSGADASLAVAHHLIASEDAEVAELLDHVVIVMDPVMNPDGRERFLAMVEQSAGYVTNLDYASMHRGRWPQGRGNHYLFDMNRDWMTGVMPETRGRWQVALAYHPQLFVDAHEMDAMDTFLFYPQSDPHLPSLPEKLGTWQKRFTDDAARVFDRMGWAYYTREWADAWAPIYSDAWGSLNGAVGMLYEQAGIGGAPLERASGRVVSYRSAVHGQALASLTNLETLRANRAEILRDYLAARRKNCSMDRPGGERAFVLVPRADESREALFLKTLIAQGIEVWRVRGELRANDATDGLGTRGETHTFPAGSYVVPLAQPQGSLVDAYLGFDPRMGEDFLLEERKKLEKESISKIYDVTAWDLGHAYGLDAWWCTPEAAERDLVPASEPEACLSAPGAVVPSGQGPAWAWIVDGGDDASLRFAAHALELGLAVHLADEPFSVSEWPERVFARGTILVRRQENADGIDEEIERAAGSSRAKVLAISSGRAPAEGPDLGGGHFHLLARPRIALLANAPIEREGFGHIWHYLDTDLAVPVTLLDVQDLRAHDLRRYNVLLVPPGDGLAGLLEPMAADLRTWISGGGTLIACGSAAAELVSPKLGLSSVRERAEILDELELWNASAERETDAESIEIDPDLLWNGTREKAADESEENAAEAKDAGEEEDALVAEREKWMRRFSPSGSFLRARVDPEAWLAFGAPPTMPVFFIGADVLCAKEPVRTPVRLAPTAELRLSGLLWPEARERLAGSAWLSREAIGRGQIVLFASPPAFRGYFRASLRLLANAILFGPGMGASQPLER